MTAGCRQAHSGSWDDPAGIQAAAGLPEPARRCENWLLPLSGGRCSDDRQCEHFAAYAITAGCEREHISGKVLCACCLDYLENRPVSCAIDYSPVGFACLTLLYPDRPDLTDEADLMVG